MRSKKINQKNFLLIIITLFLSMFSSESVAQKTGKNEKFRTEHYFKICVKGSETDKSRCLLKTIDEPLPTKEEFILQFFGKNPNICTTENQKECFITVAGPFTEQLCIRDCPDPVIGTENPIGLIDDDNFENFCKRNPTNLLCILGDPAAGNPDKNNVNLTSQPQWGCAVILCLASPVTPKVCIAPLRKLWKHLFRGRPWPVCKGDTGKVNFHRYWSSSNWKKYTDLSFPILENLNECDFYGMVNKVHYKSGKPNLAPLKEMQSEYAVGSDAYNSFEEMINEITNQPPYEFHANVVSDFKIVPTPPRKDSNCIFTFEKWNAEDKETPKRLTTTAKTYYD